jgi:hypothetical protein
MVFGVLGPPAGAIGFVGYMAATASEGATFDDALSGLLFLAIAAPASYFPGLIPALLTGWVVHRVVENSLAVRVGTAVVVGALVSTVLPLISASELYDASFVIGLWSSAGGLAGLVCALVLAAPAARTP